MAAIGVRDEIEHQVQRFRNFPLTHRAGRVEGTRELVVLGTPFIVIYTTNEAVRIVRVLHGAQQWPPRQT